MSEHLCPHCGKYKTPDLSEFTQGMAVMFPRVTRLAAGVAVGTDIGVIAYEASPILFAVKCPDGRFAFARKREVTHGDQNATISIFLHGVCACGGAIQTSATNKITVETTTNYSPKGSAFCDPLSPANNSI
ncbi:hypothetical protein [uncultured Tolumonas sp.]|uniref:hypothetical protein n=1 Tax=uncultured Tolumonas sp. TaxID=263765 RepID=UPI002A0A9D82|nr:hypothetical protein [uncultured Tolumonas sp.]